MQTINTSIHAPSDTLSQLALYSGMDVLTLFEIKDGLSALMDENRQAIYDFEMELQSPLLAMSLAGIPVDEAARREMTVEFTKEQVKLTQLINDMLEAVGYFDYYRNMAVKKFESYITPLSPLPLTWDGWVNLPLAERKAYKESAPEALTVYQKALKEFSLPFNPVSPAQKLRLFYHFFGSPDNEAAEGYFFAPPWLKTYGIREHKSRNTKGEYTPGADREALEKIVKATDDPRYAAYWAAPFAHVCLAISDLSKSLGFLKCKLEHGLFKASFGVVTETGRLASRQNAQGFGSNAQNVTPKLRHIFVAPPGEKFIVCDYAQIESRIVAAICFRLFGATNYLAMTECGDAHTLCSSIVWDDLPWPQDFTLDWTIKHGPFPKDMLKAAKAIASKEFYRGKSRRDVSKTLGHGCLTADHEVLTPIGWIPISDKPDIIMQGDGTFANVSNWIDKEYNEDFVLWEGLSISLAMTADHRVYYTTEKDNVYVKPAALVPKSARVFLNFSYKGGLIREPYARILAAYHCDGYYSGYKQTQFHFHKSRKIIRLHKLALEAGITISPREDTSKVILNWIPEIHAPCWGMLLWDRESLAAYMDELKYWDGTIGNAHITLFSKNREWLEMWQTFNRLLGKGGNIQKPYISGFGTEVYRLQVNNRQYASRDSFTVDVKCKAVARVYCPTVPAQSFYVRRNSKICVTGNSNYMGRPPQMSKHSHIDVKLIEHYQSVYFDMCPELLKWHRWVAEQVQTKGEITTMLGRTRRFFGRPNDDATIREAVAYEPQSVAADYCNRALLRLHKMVLAGEFPGVIRLSKHDELVVSCNESLEELVLGIMREQMEEHITLVTPGGTARDWFIPAEAESGWNLGKRVVDKETKKVTNPNGLSHPLDGRMREVGKGWKVWRV